MVRQRRRSRRATARGVCRERSRPACVTPRVAQLGAKCQEMIILDPETTESGLRKIANSARRDEGISLRDRRYNLPARHGSDRLRECSAGPQRRIGKGLRNSRRNARPADPASPAHPAPKASISGKNGSFLVPVTDPPRGTDPNRARFLHHGQQGSRQSTRHGFVGACRARDRGFETTTRFTGVPS